METVTTVREWRPHPGKQETFLSLPDSIFEGFYGGAAGGGKSESLMMFPLVRKFHQYPQYKGIIFRRTFPELEKEIILRAHQYYRSEGGHWNDQKKYYTFPSGATQHFGHCEYEKDIRKYDTSEFNYAGFDELTSFTEFQYTYITLTRVRSSSNLPAIVRSGSNPGNVGHGWVRKRFVEPNKEGMTVLFDPVTKTKRIFIPALLTDNPTLMENDPGYIFRLDGLPEAELRAKKYGDWWTFSGQVFDTWRNEPFSDEPMNAQHVIEPFEIPDWWPVVLSVDWGYRAMTWAGWGAASPDGRCYLKKEYAVKEKEISEWATEIGIMSRDENLLGVALCGSAWQRRGDALTIAQQFQKFSGLKPERADSDRVGGKVLFQEYLRWAHKPKRAAQREDFDLETAQNILRNRGQESYLKYLAYFESEKEEENLPKLQVFNTCAEFINCIPLCVYDDKNTEDVAEFSGDDPYDGGRYLLKMIDRHFRGLSKEHQLRSKEAEIYKDFEGDRNWNKLHMRMRLVEREKRLKNSPVRRHHKSRRTSLMSTSPTW